MKIDLDDKFDIDLPEVPKKEKNNTMGVVVKKYFGLGRKKVYQLKFEGGYVKKKYCKMDCIPTLTVYEDYFKKLIIKK